MRRPDQRTFRRARHHTYRQTPEHPLLDGVARVRHGQDPTNVMLRRIGAMVVVFVVAAGGLALVNRSGGGNAVDAADPAAPAKDVQDSQADVIWSTDPPTSAVSDSKAPSRR